MPLSQTELRSASAFASPPANQAPATFASQQQWVHVAGTKASGELAMTHVIRNLLRDEESAAIILV